MEPDDFLHSRRLFSISLFCTKASPIHSPYIIKPSKTYNKESDRTDSKAIQQSLDYPKIFFAARLKAGSALWITASSTQ